MKPSTPTAGVLISLAAANAGATWAQFVTSTLTKTKTLTAHVRDDVATAVLLQKRQEEVTVQRTITTTERRSQQPTVAPSSSPPSSQANSQQQQQQQQSQSNEPQSTNIQADNTNSPTNSAPTGTATVSPDAGNSNGNHGPTKSQDGSSSSSSSSSTPSSSSSGAAAAAGHSSGGGGLGAGAAAGIAAGAVAGLALTAAVVFLLWRRKQGGVRGAVITADYPRDYDANQQQQLSVDDESQGSSRLPPMPTPMMMMRSPATFPRLEHQPGPAGNMAGRQQQQQPEYYPEEQHQSQYSLPPPAAAAAAAAAAAGNSAAIDHPDPFSDYSPVVPPMPAPRRPTLDRFSFEAAVAAATPQRHPQQQEAYPDYSGSGFGYSPGTVVVDRPGPEATGYYQPGHSQSSSSTSSTSSAAVVLHPGHRPDGRGQESRPFSWEVPRDYSNDNNNDDDTGEPRQQQPQQTATARHDPPLPISPDNNTFELLLPTFMIPGGDHQRARAMSFGGPSSSSSAARQRRATQRVEVPPQLPLPQPLSPLPSLPPPLPPRSSGSWPLQGSEVVVQRGGGGGGGSRSGQRRRTMTTGAMDTDNMDTVHNNTHVDTNDGGLHRMNKWEDYESPLRRNPMG